jgi:hypothetical protein
VAGRPKKPRQELEGNYPPWNWIVACGLTHARIEYVVAAWDVAKENDGWWTDEQVTRYLTQRITTGGTGGRRREH